MDDIGPDGSSKYISADAVCEMLGIGEDGLLMLMMAGILPVPCGYLDRDGNAVLYEGQSRAREDK